MMSNAGDSRTSEMSFLYVTPNISILLPLIVLPCLFKISPTFSTIYLGIEELMLLASSMNLGS